jgi:hypothetical protein
MVLLPRIWLAGRRRRSFCARATTASESAMNPTISACSRGGLAEWCLCQMLASFAAGGRVGSSALMAAISARLLRAIAPVRASGADIERLQRYPALATLARAAPHPAAGEVFSGDVQHLAHVSGKFRGVISRPDNCAA